MRLDKVIADMGIGTRNEIRKACRALRITVNGETVKDPSVHVDPETDLISIDGEPIQYQKYVYFMLNKPKGVISSTSDREPTVIELIDCTVKGLYPVGRLDRDTEGLLLITNDGPLGHQLLSPRHHVEKEYLVTARDAIREADCAKIRTGMKIDKGEVTLPAEIALIGDRECRLILREGKYHEIKRMFAALHNEVIALKRIRMKDLVLDETLKPGEYRALTEEEIASLYD